MLVTSGDTIRLRYPADPGATGLYPQAKIRRDDNNALVDTVDLAHDADGWYSGEWLVPSWAGYRYEAVVTVYTDSNHTIADTTYDRLEIEIDHAEMFRNGGGDDVRGRIFSRAVEKTAGAQLDGSEFLIGSNNVKAFRFLELIIEAGSESKDLSIDKVSASGAVVTLWESAGNTSTSIVLTRADFDTILAPDDDLKLYSTSATAAIKTKLYLERVENGYGVF